MGLSRSHFPRGLLSRQTYPLRVPPNRQIRGSQNVLRLGIGGTLAAVTCGVVGGLIYAGLNWPSDWEHEAQATLAAALIVLVGTVGSVAVKYIVDQLALVTQHSLNVRLRMLDKFYEYAGHYVMPLAAAAGETARYLTEYASASPERRAEKLDSAFYSAAQYVRLQATFKSTFSLPGVDPPLGILMSSHQAERRLWNLAPPAWALGVTSLTDESALLAALTDDDGKMRPPKAFIDCAHDPTSPAHRVRQTFVARVTSDSALLRDLINVLNTLNLLINYEVGRVYAAWYTDSAEDPKDQLKGIESLPAEQKGKLGISYPLLWWLDLELVLPIVTLRFRGRKR